MKMEISILSKNQIRYKYNLLNLAWEEQLKCNYFLSLLLRVIFMEKMKFTLK
jgi:hypothetical protein